MSLWDWIGAAAAALLGVPLILAGLLVVVFGATLSADLGRLRPKRARAVPSDIRAYRPWRALLSRTNAGGRAVSAGRHRAPEAPDALTPRRPGRPASHPPIPPTRGVVACLGCGLEWHTPPGSDPATELVAHQRSHHAGAHRDEEVSR